MTDFTKSVRDALIPKGGRKKYHDLYKEQLAERAGEHKVLAEAFQETVKTMNGFSQLAAQQVKQIASLSQTIVEMKTNSPSVDDADESEEAEVKGE